ncbi:MAG TPA: TIR domain-containing protein [Kofleriaceae bacterium]
MSPHESTEGTDRDVFVLHADEDTPFVQGELLPMLGLPDDRVILSSELPFPGFIEHAIAASVRRSRLTLAILSPAYLRDRWVGFAELLSRNVRDDGRGGSLVPLLLADCDVPEVLAQHAMLDCRTPAQRAASTARIRERLGRPDPVLGPIACPYPGMQPFTAATASQFYGRTDEISKLLGLLDAGDPSIYVIGPSGSGKSSLIAAGLIPQLARKSRHRFAVRKIRPGESPMRQLAEALACDPASVGGAVAALLEREACERLLVFVDQLEELFAQADADERHRFVQALGVLRADNRCHQVMALRADFYGALMSSELWPDIEGRFSRLEVAALRGESLREAIVTPAREAGVYLERELVERLIADAAAEPGALPLLQEALVLLWGDGGHRLLRLASYDALGEAGRSGLAVALANRADAVLHRLSLPQQALARRIFLRLVSFGEGRPDTRRQQSRAALAASGQESAHVDAVIDRLIDARMLTSDASAGGEPLVDLAHEALIGGWPEFQRWLLARRDDEQRRRLLELRAAEWTKRGRGGVGLFDAVELGEAERWIAGDTARELGYSDNLLRFLAASRAAIVEAERRDQRAREDRERERSIAEHERMRLRRRLRRFATGALIVFSITATVLGLLAWQQRQESERERLEAEHQLALNERDQARSLIVESGDRAAAIPHLAEAVRLGMNDPELRDLLADVNSGLWRITLGHGQPLTAVSFSPDGEQIVTASGNGTARIWDTATGTLVSGSLAHDKEVWSAAFSPDGSLVVTASEDGTARVWNAATGSLFREPFKHDAKVWSAVFSPDGKRIVTACGDHTARVWDVASAAPIGAPLAHASEVLSASFSPDGTLIASASRDGTARIWNAGTGRPIGLPLKHEQAVHAAVFSPDGARIVTASEDGTARIWDAATGMPIGAPLRHEKAVHSAVFSPDGTRIVTASGDGTARIWDAATGTPIGAPLQHERAVWSAAFSPTGTRVLTTSLDGTARVWYATNGAPFSVPLPHDGPVRAAAFHPSGDFVVTASWDGTARVWDITTDTAHRAAHERKRAVSSPISSPDGTRLVTLIRNDSAKNGTARIWDSATGAPTSIAITDPQGVHHLAFNPDGTRFVTASGAIVRVWNAATGEPVTPRLITCPPPQDCNSTEALLEVAMSSQFGFSNNSITRLRFSADGARVIAYASRVNGPMWGAKWDATTGSLITTRANVSGFSFGVEDSVFESGESDVSNRSDRDERLTDPWLSALDGASLSTWAAQAARCGPSGDAVGPHRLCPISEHAATPGEELERVRSVIALGDVAMFSSVWSLPRARYQQARSLLDPGIAQQSTAQQRGGQELQRIIALRLAILDALAGDLAHARPRLGADAPPTDALLLDRLGAVAHDDLQNPGIALRLLQRAHALDPRDAGVLAHLAELYFVTRNHDPFTRCLADLDKLPTSADLQVAVAALAWADARLARLPETGHRSRLVGAYHQLADGARIGRTWKGTAHALGYGRFQPGDVKPVLDLLAFLEHPVTDVTRATFADLLELPTSSRHRAR